MFKKSEERQAMLEELRLILQHRAKFTAYCDGIFNYELILNDVKYDFSIIADDDFVSEMEVEWLLDLKRVRYFENRIYLLDSRKAWVFEGSKTFSVKNTQ